MEWLEPRAAAGDAVSANYLGLVYLTIARISAANSESKANYGYKAIGTLRELVIRHPDYVDGLKSLASITDDESERIDLLSRAIDLNPSGQMTREVLANTLTHRGGREDLLRAAQLMEGEYALGDHKYWYAAAKAVALYDSAGAGALADQLRQDARSRAGVDRVLGDIARGGLSAGQITNSLDVICHRYLMEAIGGQACLTGIQQAGQQIVASKSDPFEAKMAADGMVKALASLSESPTGLERSSPGWREKVSTLIDAFRKRGIASYQIEGISVRFTNDDKRKLQAMERAVQLAPDDTGSLVSLAQEYMDRGRYDDAEKMLQNARMMRGESPEKAENYRKAVDQYLEVNEQLRQRATQRQNGK
jgi:tetratricopeptide (TPR) repeat protein